MQEPKAGRRIVSWGAYVVIQGYVTISRAVGVLFFVLSFCFAVATLWCFFMIVSGQVFVNNGASKYMVCIPMLVTFAPFTYFLYRAGRNGFSSASKINLGVSLTRANTADLLAPEILVRASRKPMQGQEGVLLRAASREAQAGKEGQLLRAITSE